MSFNLKQIFSVPVCMILHFALLIFRLFILFIFSKLVTHFFLCDALILHYQCAVLSPLSSTPHQLLSSLNILSQCSTGLFPGFIFFAVSPHQPHKSHFKIRFTFATHLAFCQLVLSLSIFDYTSLSITSLKYREKLNLSQLYHL